MVVGGLASLMPLEVVGLIFLCLKKNPANSHFSIVCSLFQVDLGVAAKSQVENTNVYFVVTTNRQWKP